MSPMETKGIYQGSRTLSVMPTFKCNASCANCGTLSHPGEGMGLDLTIMLNAISQASRLGFGNVVFTGGEATLRWKDLLRCLEHAKAEGLITRVVTNGVWAKNLTLGHKRIGELRQAGLDEVNFSTGDEHVKFVPLEWVVNGILVSIDHGLKPHVMVECKNDRTITKDLLLRHPAIASISTEPAPYTISESPWMPLDPQTVESYPSNIATNSGNLAACTGCDSVLQTTVLQADGRIGACCGLGMRLIPELNVATVADDKFIEKAVDVAENDFLKLWLRYEGPEKILAWAASKDQSIKWEDMYGHRCQACMRIYSDTRVAKVIKEHYQEKIPKIICDAWMEEVFIPQSALVKASTDVDQS
jgi:hypothetical protein